MISRVDQAVRAGMGVLGENILICKKINKIRI